MLISGYCLQNLFLGKSKVVSILMLMVRIIVLKAAFNIIQSYCVCQFYCWRKPKYPKKTTDLQYVT